MSQSGTNSHPKYRRGVQGPGRSSGTPLHRGCGPPSRRPHGSAYLGNAATRPFSSRKLEAQGVLTEGLDLGPSVGRCPRSAAGRQEAALGRMRRRKPQTCLELCRAQRKEPEQDKMGGLGMDERLRFFSHRLAPKPSPCLLSFLRFVPFPINRLCQSPDSPTLTIPHILACTSAPRPQGKQGG